MEIKQIKALTEKINGKMVAIASTDTIDRVGDSLKVDNWDFKNFKNNPVLLAGHDYRPQYVIGVAKNLKSEGNKIIFEPVFHTITNIAKELKQMYEEGILKAWSVGFIPGTKNELLEVSAVAVPANAEALMLEMKSLDIAKQNKLESQLKEFVNSEKNEVENCEVKKMTEEIVESQEELEIEEKYGKPGRSGRKPGPKKANALKLTRRERILLTDERKIGKLHDEVVAKMSKMITQGVYIKENSRLKLKFNSLSKKLHEISSIKFKKRESYRTEHGMKGIESVDISPDEFRTNWDSIKTQLLNDFIDKKITAEEIIDDLMNLTFAEYIDFISNVNEELTNFIIDKKIVSEIENLEEKVLIDIQGEVVENESKEPETIAEELDEQAQRTEKYKKVSVIDNYLYAFYKVYMDKDTKVDKFGELVKELAGLLLELAGENDVISKSLIDFSGGIEEIYEMKEGRVLSDKNRKLITSCVSILNESATVLDNLLTTTNSTKNVEVEVPESIAFTKVEQPRKSLKKLTNQELAVRILKEISKHSSYGLNKLKNK
jgi:hypothetical protein